MPAKASHGPETSVTFGAVETATIPVPKGTARRGGAGTRGRRYWRCSTTDSYPWGTASMDGKSPITGELPTTLAAKQGSRLLAQWKRSLNQTLVTTEACPGATDLVADATGEDGSRTFSCVRGYGFGVPQVPLASILGHVKPISRNFETVLKITLHNVSPSLPWATKWPCSGYPGEKDPVG